MDLECRSGGGGCSLQVDGDLDLPEPGSRELDAVGLIDAVLSVDAGLRRVGIGGCGAGDVEEPGGDRFGRLDRPGRGILAFEWRLIGEGQIRCAPDHEATFVQEDAEEEPLRAIGRQVVARDLGGDALVDRFVIPRG